MIVPLSYLKGISLPLLPKKVDVFVYSVWFCLFGGGGILLLISIALWSENINITYFIFAF